MNSKDTYIATLLILVAAVAWGGAVFFAQTVGSMEEARVAAAQNMQESAVTQSAIVRTHSIAQQTASVRAQLDQLLTVDVGSAATMLRDVGKTTHVTVKLSDALPEASAAPASAHAESIQAVGFALQADGTFEALMRTAQLLETLPLASQIERFDIQGTQKEGSADLTTWHMSVYIRVLTTSTI